MSPPNPSRVAGLSELERRVIASIDVDGMLESLAELIAIPSVANEETPAQEHMAYLMESVGLDIDLWPIDFTELRAHPAYAADVARERGLGLVGSVPPAGVGPALIVNGHIDVVPAGEPDRWSYPPWELTEVRGRLYGRGVVDMKGALCCGLFAAKAILDAGVALEGTLQLHSVIGEEDGGAGTLATILRGHTGDGAIVVEPTGFMLAPSQAGALSFRITVPGRAAHGALREEGVDPIEKFIPVFRALRSLEAVRNAEVQDPLFRGQALPFALTMGRLRAGIWPSTVAESLVVEGRYGVAPGEDPQDARQQLETAVSRAAAKDAWLVRHPPRVEWWGSQFHGARTDPADPVVAAVSDAAAAVSGTAPVIRGVRFGADMRLLVNQGHIPTVLFGPGDVREAHRPDESVLLDDLVRATQILAVTSLRYCGVSAESPT